MQVLLAANASYVPPRGGATRSNLVWLDELARAGHECRVVSAAAPRDTAAQRALLESELRQQQIRFTPAVDLARDAVELARYRDIAVYSTADPARRCALLREQIRGFQPDWVMVSSEDIGQVLLREALAAAPGRVIYLAHTPQFFGFGPESWNPDPHGVELMRAVAGIVAIGHHMAGYIERHCGRPAAVVHPPVYGPGPWTPCASFEQVLISMINPCTLKGLPIFLELARRFPQHAFGALPGWGTTAADRSALAALPNVTLLPRCPDIEDFLRQTRLLLMPSLWYEGFGLIVVEAMLRSIPVVASDSGGLAEAKLGTGFVIPVRPIEAYLPEYDEHVIPKAVLPEQDIEPWAAAVECLCSNREMFECESRAARQAALRFVKGVRPGQFQKFLETLAPAEAPSQPGDLLARLSPEKRALLLERLRRRTRH
jgi:glycosyltransferase involved in cell wall biosynthesis